MEAVLSIGETGIGERESLKNGICIEWMTMGLRSMLGKKRRKGE